MPYSWPAKRTLLGTGVPRLDGALKVNGKAKYSFDRNLPGMLHAKVLRSPHAHCKVLEIDLKPAEAMPGVKAVHVIKGAGSELRYAGDEIAALAAETEEQARDAVRAIKVKYEVLPFEWSEELGFKKGGTPKTDQTTDADGKPNVEPALAKADAVIEGTYSAPVITHVCLESHGLVAWWKADDELVVYASTQAVGKTAGDLKGDALFKGIPNLKVTCETPFMGGGFGSKFGPDIQGVVAAQLARLAKRPVKLMLERDEEHWAGGNRPSAFAKVKAGATKDGKLTAFDAVSYGTGGHTGGAIFPLPYIYAPETRRRVHTDVAVNAGDRRALRAPGHPQGCIVTEQVMDDLADKLGLDPIEFRIKNIPDQGLFKTLKPIYVKELALGAERIGWKKDRHPRGDKTPGPIKRGFGCAINTWGGGAGQAQATCTIHPDGSVEAAIGTQDLGTGTTTLVPMVAAEILGLQVKDVTGKIGSSIYPPAGGSGGSTSCGGVSVAVGIASMNALAALFEKAAPKIDSKPADLQATGGRIVSSNGKSLSWKQACATLGQQPVVGNGDRKDGDTKDAQGKVVATMSSQGVGGAQFADVSVDIETGEVRVNKIVAVADCGMVMNRLLCESQVFGGVIGALNSALFEERRLDPKTGLMLNPDLEWYKLAGHTDIPDIEVHLLDYPERGVIGIGEPPYIPGAAAIANAVTNAVGVRVGDLPFTPRLILDALAKK
ncbi:MAG: xanthine dehydrogenase family protein molybdopterin-binding subunit [Planctomycetes bacterium]|nr:xanthine dehydrogenase family protein molybdopterin-binding subunit [Planctomycetota bacterium]